MGSELRQYRLIAAALLTTFNEVDMTAVNELRARYKDAFLERLGIKLGFMSYFVKAAVDGREAVTFLRRIKDLVECPERLWLQL